MTILFISVGSHHYGIKYLSFTEQRCQARTQESLCSSAVVTFFHRQTQHFWHLFQPLIINRLPLFEVKECSKE